MQCSLRQVTLYNINFIPTAHDPPNEAEYRGFIAEVKSQGSFAGEEMNLCGWGMSRFEYDTKRNV
jgi:hypothetical protein